MLLSMFAKLPFSFEGIILKDVNQVRRREPLTYRKFPNLAFVFVCTKHALLMGSYLSLE